VIIFAREGGFVTHLSDVLPPAVVVHAGEKVLRVLRNLYDAANGHWQGIFKVLLAVDAQTADWEIRVHPIHALVLDHFVLDLGGFSKSGVRKTLPKLREQQRRQPSEQNGAKIAASRMPRATIISRRDKV
jgi:hypothetical protein